MIGLEAAMSASPIARHGGERAPREARQVGSAARGSHREPDRAPDEQRPAACATNRRPAPFAVAARGGRLPCRVGAGLVRKVGLRVQPGTIDSRFLCDDREVHRRAAGVESADRLAHRIALLFGRSACHPPYRRRDGQPPEPCHTPSGGRQRHRVRRRCHPRLIVMSSSGAPSAICAIFTAR